MDAPAGWYPDPLGRFEHRYWDGTRWTDHASRGGRTVADPLDATAPPDAGQHAAATGAPPGQSFPDRATEGPAAGTEGLAIVSIVLSVAWLFGLGSIAGIITGIVARRRIRASGGARTGAGLALAGIIIGIVTLGLTVLVVLAVAAFTIGGVSTNFAVGTL